MSKDSVWKDGRKMSSSMHETLKEGVRYLGKRNTQNNKKLNKLSEQRKLDMLWLQHALSTRERKKNTHPKRYKQTLRE